MAIVIPTIEAENTKLFLDSSTWNGTEHWYTHTARPFNPYNITYKTSKIYHIHTTKMMAQAYFVSQGLNEKTATIQQLVDSIMKRAGMKKEEFHLIPPSNVIYENNMVIDKIYDAHIDLTFVLASDLEKCKKTPKEQAWLKREEETTFYRGFSRDAFADNIIEVLKNEGYKLDIIDNRIRFHSTKDWNNLVKTAVEEYVNSKISPVLQCKIMCPQLSPTCKYKMDYGLCDIGDIRPIIDEKTNK